MASSALKPKPKRASKTQPASEDHAMTADTQPEQRGWGVEKRIRIEFVIGMVMTIAGYVWYAGKIDTKVEYQEDRLVKLEQLADALATDRNAMSVRMTKLEGKQEQAVGILERVERTVSELNRKAK